MADRKAGGEKRNREAFAMVPESVLLNPIVPNGKPGDDERAIALYACLDLRQGQNGWPVRGYNYASKMLGWQERTVSRFAKILAEVGLIELDEGDTSGARRQVWMKVIHNPSRGRVNPNCALGAVDRRKALPKNGIRAAHKKRPRPAIASANYDDEQLSPQTPDAPDAERPVDPVVRRAHVRPCVVRAPLVRETQIDVRTPGARHAPQPRSRSSSVDVSDEGPGYVSDPDDHTAAVSMLRRAFGSVQVLEVCSTCARDADGRAGQRGEPYCCECEPFV